MNLASSHVMYGENHHIIYLGAQSMVCSAGREGAGLQNGFSVDLSKEFNNRPVLTWLAKKLEMKNLVS